MMCMHLHSSLGWFDHIEPTLSQGVHDVYALTQQFGVVRSHSTIPNYTLTGGTWCVGHLHSNSGWFNHIEPTLLQGVHDLYALTQQFGVVRSYP